MIAYLAYTTVHAERDIEHVDYVADTAVINRTVLGAGRDVVEHQLIGAVIAVAAREFDDLSDDAMVAKAQALDHLVIPDIEAGNYATRKNGCSPSSRNLSSSIARPRMAAATPSSA